LDALTAYLPVIVLIIFQIVLPDLMCAFARGEGIITKSDVEAKVCCCGVRAFRTAIELLVMYSPCHHCLHSSSSQLY
jgi:hypothetical protein